MLCARNTAQGAEVQGLLIRLRGQGGWGVLAYCYCHFLTLSDHQHQNSHPTPGPPAEQRAGQVLGSPSKYAITNLCHPTPLIRESRDAWQEGSTWVPWAAVPAKQVNVPTSRGSGRGRGHAERSSPSRGLGSGSVLFLF